MTRPADAPLPLPRQASSPYDPDQESSPQLTQPSPPLSTSALVRLYCTAKPLAAFAAVCHAARVKFASTTNAWCPAPGAPISDLRLRLRPRRRTGQRHRPTVRGCLHMAMNDFERVGRNLVRTFYDPLPTNDSNDPIWLLGQRYEPRLLPSKQTPGATPSEQTPSPTPLSERTEDESWIRTSIDDKDRNESPNGQDPAQYGNWPSAFLDDFESRIWMTYRSGFAAIQKSQDPKATSAMSFRVRMQNLASPGFTSDTGFGCMIRSGQCILANALQTLRLGRDWRYQSDPLAVEHSNILSLFADDPKAPFSIHRFVEHGAAVCGKYPGEWFGPSAAARCIQDLVMRYKDADLRVYVSGDGADVYEDKLKQIALEADGEWKPTLILVGTRLGIEKITPVYWEALKASLQMKQSLGIAG